MRWNGCNAKRVPDSNWFWCLLNVKTVDMNIYWFSCKRRHFCPSCHQKRVVEFGEWLGTEVLKYVPHRQWVFSIPKRLRIYFMFDRKLLTKLSRCAWKVLSRYLKQTMADEDAVPGAVITVQSFSDFLGFNCHLHVIATDPPEGGSDIADFSVINPVAYGKKQALIMTIKPWLIRIYRARRFEKIGHV